VEFSGRQFPMYLSIAGIIYMHAVEHSEDYTIMLSSLKIL
jgi:hypothetical protein